MTKRRWTIRVSICVCAHKRHTLLPCWEEGHTARPGWVGESMYVGGEKGEVSHYIQKKPGEEKKKEHICMSVRVSHTHDAAAGKGRGEEERGASHKCVGRAATMCRLSIWVGGRQQEGKEGKDITECMHEVRMRAKKKDNQSITSSTPHQEEQMQVKRHTQQHRFRNRWTPDPISSHTRNAHTTSTAQKFIHLKIAFPLLLACSFCCS